MGEAWHEPSWQSVGHKTPCYVVLVCCVCRQWTLNDVRAIQRPLLSELENEVVFNIVWSDPIPELPMDPRRGAHTSERDNFKGTKCSI